MNSRNSHQSRSAALSPLPLRVLVIAILLIASTLTTSAAVPTPAPAAEATGLQAAPSPYLVIENVGQFAPEVQFMIAQGNQRIWLTEDAVWLTVADPAPVKERVRSTDRMQRPAATPQSGTALRFTFAGASNSTGLEPYGRLPTHVSYLIGSDPAGWHADVPVWSGVRYRDLYPGIDLVVGGEATGIVPWSLEARSGASLDGVTLRVEGAGAATTEGGTLRFDLKGQTIDVASPGLSVHGQESLAATTAVVQSEPNSFGIASQAEGQAPEATAISPAETQGLADLVYSRLLGGSAGDAGNAIAVDSAGNAYITGSTHSDAFTGIPGTFTAAPSNVFVAKLDAGGVPSYVTFLGGNGADAGQGIAVLHGQAHIAGESQSTDFPDAAGGPDSDVFVAALNANGTGMSYAVRLSGHGYDAGFGIAVDGTGSYVVGTTDSTDLGGSCTGVTVENPQVLVAKFDLSGEPVYRTCHGGDGNDSGSGIAVANGLAYVTGTSYPDDSEILVAVFTETGVLSDSAEIGGSGDDSGDDIAVDIDADGNGNIYVSGTTYSNNFPSAGTRDTTRLDSDAVIVRLSTAFLIDAAAYLGGDGEEVGQSIAIDTVKALYVAGTTDSTEPLTIGSPYDPDANGGSDAFVARLGVDLAPTYATYLGGTLNDDAFAIETDTGGHAFVVGSTFGGGFPNPTPPGPEPAGADDSYVVKLKVSSPPAAPANVAISGSADGKSAVLTWTPSTVGVARYQLIRGTVPYFKAGDWSSEVISENGAASGQTDSNVLTQEGGLYYVVKAVSAPPEHASASSSPQVGKFTFSLVPGTLP